MKVTTDGCLFGAYIANAIDNLQLKIDNCLDIGTGTGLLSLMLAQKVDTIIETVEIDKASYLQAKENFEQSPWKKRLTIFNADILQFKTNKKYDCIITNPPFFEGDLRSVDENKNNAKHDTSLTLQQLLKVIDTNLTGEGSFFSLLPFHRSDYFETAAAALQFHLVEKIIVRQTLKHEPFRTILHFSRKAATAIVSELSIKDNEGNYTTDFTSLLKDYYLQL
jgi:tRNA1Val (adenine37-N6)-methyltransferase